MKAVTVRRPYIDAIFDVNCRVLSMPTNTHHRGAIALRASPRARDVSPAAQRVEAFRAAHCARALIKAGVVAGIAELVSTHSVDDCEMTGPCAVIAADGTCFAKILSKRPGLFHWVLRDVREADEPIRLPRSAEAPREHSAVWDLPQSVTARLLAAVLVRDSA